jgi:hypothetical protein
MEDAIRAWSDEVRHARGIVVPFGFVRMFELRSEANGIVNDVCHHLSRVLEALQIDLTRDRIPWMEFANEMLTESAWRRLSAALAARTGDHGQRRKYLDIEAYAVEAEEISRQVVEFPRIFDTFIEALASDYRKARLAPQPPIFVFAVTETVGYKLDELEKAFKTLSHQRLVFLLA